MDHFFSFSICRRSNKYVSPILLHNDPFMTTIQNIVDHGNAAVRLLWFGIVIQFILLVEVFEVVISGNMSAYAVQISIFSALVTVFAVLGANQNIYASSGAQLGIGAGWLITAIVDLLWIIYFTSPPDSHFIRLASAMSYAPFFEHAHRGPKIVEKISRSEDAFVMSPPNGSGEARPGAEALIGLDLDKDDYATLAVVDIDKLKEERMRGPERTSGYDFDNIPAKRGSRTRSGGVWSTYTPSSGPRSSGVTDVPREAEREASALNSERPTSEVSTPDTPSPQSPHSKTTQSKATRMVIQPITHSQPPPEPLALAPWRAEALFDCQFFISFLTDFSRALCTEAV